MRAARAGAVIAAALLVVAGCGGGGSDTKQALHDQVRAVRADLEAGRLSEAKGDLARLRATVRDANASGDIDDSKAASILGAANNVESTMAMLAAPPTTTTTAPAPAPAPTKGHTGEGRKGGGKKDD